MLAQHMLLLASYALLLNTPQTSVVTVKNDTLEGIGTVYYS